MEIHAGGMKYCKSIRGKGSMYFDSFHSKANYTIVL